MITIRYNGNQYLRNNIRDSRNDFSAVLQVFRGHTRPMAASLCTFEQDFQQLSLLLLNAVLGPQLTRANCPHGMHRSLIKQARHVKNYLLDTVSFNYTLLATARTYL